MVTVLDMPQRPVGSSGIHVSALGFGTWMTFGDVVRDGTAGALVRAALDAGVTFFDTADSYALGEAERMLGACLAGVPRDHYVLSSKVFFPLSDDPADRGLSRRHIFNSIDRSLRHLRTDHLDLYFCHRPDPETPLAESVQAMSDLVRQGKIRHWGTSEWSPARIRQACQIARGSGWYAPTVEQPHYNLLNRTRFEITVAPTLRRHGMGAVTWSPLASGALTGKYTHSIPPQSRLGRSDWLRDDTLTVRNQTNIGKLCLLARERGCTPAQLAIAYVASHPAVSSVILGASSVEQLSENLKSLSVGMTAEMRARLQRLFRPSVKELIRQWIR